MLTICKINYNLFLTWFLLKTYLLSVVPWDRFFLIHGSRTHRSVICSEGHHSSERFFNGKWNAYSCVVELDCMSAVSWDIPRLGQLNVHRQIASFFSKVVCWRVPEPHGAVWITAGAYQLDTNENISEARDLPYCCYRTITYVPLPIFPVHFFSSPSG